MLVYRGAAAFMGMLAQVTVPVDMHMCEPGYMWFSLSYPHNPCPTPTGQGLKLGLLAWEGGVPGGDPEPHASLAGHQAWW